MLYFIEKNQKLLFKNVHLVSHKLKKKIEIRNAKRGGVGNSHIPQPLTQWGWWTSRKTHLSRVNFTTITQPKQPKPEISLSAAHFLLEESYPSASTLNHFALFAPNLEHFPLQDAMYVDTGP